MKTSSSVIAATAAAAAVMAAPAAAQDVTFGVIGGVSGPIAELAPPIIDASRLAFETVNEQGGLLDGRMIEAAVGDSGCNPQSGGDAAAKALNVDGAVAIVGAHCSGATLAAANTVTIPAGRILISPASTAPALTGLDDGDTVFRVVPADDYQGAALARTLKGLGYGPIAVTYLNNDYGKGLAEAFRAEYEAHGGEIAAFEAHEEGKPSYRSELAELSRSGADTVAIFAYSSGSGLTMMREALENGFFERFVGGDGMKADNLLEELGAENLTTFVASAATGQGGAGLEAFNAIQTAAGANPDDVYVTSGFDAGFLLALAYEHAGGDVAKMVASLRAVATAPGEPILPGEWEKAKGLIAAGEEIDYKGAAGDHEFDMNGDVPGVFALFEVSGDGYSVLTEMK
jgi:branched-chain amino acid transport system substrate-binding protein